MPTMGRHGVKARWPIEQVQIDRGCSLVSIAREYADAGLSLREMALSLSIGYSALKGALKRRNYRHPQGLELIEKRFTLENGMTLEAYIQLRISKQANRNLIAEETGIDPATLQKFADVRKLVFPKTCRERDYTNIISAIKRRTAERTDLVKIEYAGREWYLKELVDHYNINRSTFLRRRKLGWSIDEALRTPVRGTSPKPRAKRATTPNSEHPWRRAEKAFHQEWVEKSSK